MIELKTTEGLIEALSAVQWDSHGEDAMQAATHDLRLLHRIWPLLEEFQRARKLMEREGYFDEYTNACDALSSALEAQ